MPYKDPEKQREADRKYRKTEKGRTSSKRNKISEKGKVSNKRYRQSAKGKASRKESDARYSTTAAGMLTEMRRNAKRRGAR